MLVWKKKEKRIEINLFLWVWAERSLIVTERGAEDAERAEGVFRSAGERCAEGSGSRGEPHWQISSKSDLKWQSALLHNRHLSTITFFSFKLLLFFFAGIQELQCTVWNEEKADRSAASASAQRWQAVRWPSTGQTGVGPCVCQG